MGRVSDARIDFQQTDEYREGWDAYEAGLSNVGPYPVWSPERLPWLTGWDDARNNEQSQ